ASIVRCINCHGHDGRGVAEGGIFPPNITWSELTKPYGAASASGRWRPAYTEALIKTTISLGRDSADRELGPSMPRYRLSIEEADALLAYLKRLGRTPEPGLTPKAVRLASVLPAGPPGASIRSALGAFIGGVNSGGGVYGRTLELQFI